MATIYRVLLAAQRASHKYVDLVSDDHAYACHFDVAGDENWLPCCCRVHARIEDTTTLSKRRQIGITIALMSNPETLVLASDKRSQSCNREICSVARLSVRCVAVLRDIELIRSKCSSGFLSHRRANVVTSIQLVVYISLYVRNSNETTDLISLRTQNKCRHACAKTPQLQSNLLHTHTNRLLDLHPTVFHPASDLQPQISPCND